MLLKFFFVLVLFFSFFIPVSAQIQFDGLKEINSTKLYLKVVGKGDPILILHSGPGMGFHYLEAFLEPLAKKHTLVFFDQRSAGKSELSLKEQMNFKNFAIDIDSIRRLLGYETMHVFGHGWGSLLAIQYAITFPNHIKTVTLCNPVPFYFGDNKQFYENQMMQFSKSDSIYRDQLLSSKEFESGKKDVVEKLMQLNFKHFFCDTLNLSKLQLNLPENYVVASLSLYGFSKDLHNYNFVPAFAEIKVPIFLLTGKCDLIPESSTQQIVSSSNTEVLYEFSHSGQFPFIEENKLFIKQMNKFLKQNKI